MNDRPIRWTPGSCLLAVIMLALSWAALIWLAVWLVELLLSLFTVQPTE